MSSDTANQSSCKQPLGRFHTGQSYSLVAVPMALCPGQLSMLAGPLAEHGEFGRFRVRRNGYELDVARGPDSLDGRR